MPALNVAKSEKRAAKRRKRYSMRCPKCKHRAWKHDFVYRPFSFLWGMGERSGNAKCRGKIEKPGPDGFVRKVLCDCDLSTEEVALNARKAESIVKWRGTDIPLGVPHGS